MSSIRRGIGQKADPMILTLTPEIENALAE